MMHKQQLDVSESGVCIFFAKTAGSLTGAVGPRGATAISILVITITMPIVIVVWALAAIMLPPSLLLDGKNSFRRTICDIVLIRPLRVFFVTLVHVPAIQRKQTNAAAAKVDPATAEVVDKPAAAAADDESESQGPAANVGKQTASTTPPIAPTPAPAPAATEVPPEDDAADVPALVELSIPTVLPREHYDALRQFAEFNLAQIQQNMHLANPSTRLTTTKLRAGFVDSSEITKTYGVEELIDKLPEEIPIDRADIMAFLRMHVLADPNADGFDITFHPENVCGVSLELAEKIAAACIGGDGKLQRAKVECFLALLVPEDCCRVTRSVLLALLANPQFIEDVLQEFQVAVLTAALLPFMQYADGNCGIISILAAIQLNYPRRMFAELKSLVENKCVRITKNGETVEVVQMDPREGHPCHLQAVLERTAMEFLRRAAQDVAAKHRRANPNEKDVLFGVGREENFDQKTDAFGISPSIFAELVMSYLGDGYRCTEIYHYDVQAGEIQSNTRSAEIYRTLSAIDSSTAACIGYTEGHYMRLEQGIFGMPLADAHTSLQQIMDAMKAKMFELYTSPIEKVLGDKIHVRQFVEKLIYHLGDYESVHLGKDFYEFFAETKPLKEILSPAGALAKWIGKMKPKTLLSMEEISKEQSTAETDLSLDTLENIIVCLLITFDIAPVYIDRCRNFDMDFHSGARADEKKTYRQTFAGICCSFTGNITPYTLFETLGGRQYAALNWDGGELQYIFKIAWPAGT